MSFSCFALHPCLLEAVEAKGLRCPTPIQEQAIPAALVGHDIFGLASTGTGKTAAFALPLLHRLLQQKKVAQVPRALVVAPTRELVMQLYDEIRVLGRHTRLRFVPIYGGVGLHGQILQLRTGADVLLACPGRVLDHVRRGHVDLSGVDILVLDEADMMFDMGFWGDVHTLLRLTRARAQTLLFSATMPSSLRPFAMEAMQNPVVLDMGAGHMAETIQHTLWPVPTHLKTPLLKHIARQYASQSLLVFVRTRHGARRLWRQLGKSGMAVTCLQGNLSQRRRRAALEGFRRGTFRVMVATDVAARGIDVSQVDYVVNYDFPPSVEACIHRAGRTGRAGLRGEAFSFVTSEDETRVRTLERAVGKPLERRWADDFDYSAPQRTEAARPARPLREPRPLRAQRARKLMEEVAQEHSGEGLTGVPGDTAKPAFRNMSKESPAPRKPRPGEYVLQAARENVLPRKRRNTP